MSNVVNSAGWIQWSSSTPNIDNVYYREYGNTGAGASGTRVSLAIFWNPRTKLTGALQASFSGQLSAANPITLLFGNGYQSWVDMTYLQ
jgi:pectinesterase